MFLKTFLLAREKIKNDHNMKFVAMFKKVISQKKSYQSAGMKSEKISTNTVFLGSMVKNAYVASCIFTFSL